MEADNNQPIVSVVMTVYNGEEFLREAIDSVLNQTLSDFELIVVNDGSTDATAEILASYADPRVRFFSQENAGCSSGLNRALTEATAEYAAVLDADDMAKPGRLQAQVQFLDARPDVTVVGTAHELRDEEAQQSTIRLNLLEHRQIRRALVRRNPLVHSSVMYRRRQILDVGGYNNKVSSFSDWELWTRVAVNHRLANLPDVLIVKRWHAGQFYRTQVGFVERLVQTARIGSMAWWRTSRRPWDLWFVTLPIFKLVVRQLVRPGLWTKPSRA